MMIDTLKLARNLQRHEFSRAQAEGLAEELRSSIEERVATKSDIESSRKDTQANIENLRKDTLASIESLRKDTKADIENLRKDTKADIENLRSETKVEFASIRKEIADLKADVRGWMLAQTLLLVAAMVGLKLFG